MAAPRSTSLHNLRQLTRQASNARQLHMTGAAAQPRLPAAKYGGLAQERRRQFEASESKAASAARPFNTSRALKTPADSSPIDLAFLPTFPIPALEYESAASLSRVPMMPAYESASASSTTSTPASTASYVSTLKPTISLVAAESTHIHTPSAMSDVHDGAQHENTDFHDVVATIASGAESVREAGRHVFSNNVDEVEKARGLLTGAWTGLMEDVFGPKTATARVA